MLNGIYGGSSSQGGGMNSGGFGGSPMQGSMPGGFGGSPIQGSMPGGNSMGGGFGGLPQNGFPPADDDFLNQLNGLSLNPSNVTPPPHPGFNGGMSIGSQSQNSYNNMGMGAPTNPFSGGGMSNPGGMGMQMGAPGLITFDNRIAELRKLGA